MESLEKWPNFFIVGAPKAGTTSLYWYFNKIPEIFMSPVKEPQYFNNEVYRFKSQYKVLDKKKYLKLFEKVKDEKILGEGTPSYLSDPESPIHIKKVSPDAHILISLRDPIERWFSHFLYKKYRSNETDLSFHEEILKTLQPKSNFQKTISNLERGLYFESVKRYLETFSSTKVKILIFEEWVKNPKEVIDETLQFLGLKRSIKNFEPTAHNPFGVPRGPVAKYALSNKFIEKISKKIFSPASRQFLRDSLLVAKKSKPKMDEESKKILKKFYSTDVMNLQTLLGKKLPWKNFHK